MSNLTDRKMKVVLISCLLLAFALSAEAGCNAMRRLKVMQQWGNSFGFAADREEFNQVVWKKYVGNYIAVL